MHIHHGSGCQWTWDEPLRLLTVADGELAATLPLETLHAFVAALMKLDEHQLALLTRALGEAANLLDLWGGDPPLQPQVLEAIGLLLMFTLAAKRSRVHAQLRAAAIAVAERLPVKSPAGAWRLAFQKHLTFAHRAGILASAEDVEVVMPVRDLVWWTARCRLDLAIEWTKARRSRADDLEAVRELRQAVSVYIAALQQEPSRRAMESFYAACGTSSEREVLRAHAAREEYCAVDDLVRADVMSWLLRRYSLHESYRLLKGTLQRAEKIGAGLAFVLTAIGIGTFAMQAAPRVQVAFQMAAFVCVVFFSPRIFSLLLPRAMFGTLLAWITVVLAQSASLLPVFSNDHGTQDQCHLWLRRVIHPGNGVGAWIGRMAAQRTVLAPPPVINFFLLVIVCILVSVVFLMVEVSGRLSTRIFGRSVYCVLVMLLGSLFWGAMLMPLLQYIVVREEFGSSCRCIYPAWLLGSVCAVAFGILVQLMWDDHSVSDSLGASGEALRAHVRAS
jgi:predicted outer membrane lipoprotein